MSLAAPRFPRALANLALSCLAAPLAAQSPQTNNPVRVKVHLDQPIAPWKPIYNWFGYDEANYTTAPHGPVLLRELHDLSPVPVYIRVHHLLTSGNGVPELKFSSTNVYTEDLAGHPVYDFKILDGIFDTFKVKGVRPMVELGFMPEALAAGVPGRSQPYQVHYPKSTISGRSNNPPKDYAKWGDLCRTVTAHLVQRYGVDAVNQWYFEVWNEPDIDYWHSSPEGYFRLYDFAVAGVRTALPTARVGGPATTSPRNPKARAFLASFLNHVANDRSAANQQPIPLDFISFHAKGQPRITNGEVSMGLTSELNDADQGFALIASLPHFKNLPIILSEADPEGCAACSSKINPANNYRNGTLYPAYTAAAYKGLLDLQARHNVNLLAMLSWSFEFEGKAYFEGFRDLSTNGVDKPILNLFRMLGRMSGTRVQITSTAEIPLDTLLQSGAQTGDIDALATVSAHTASVLVWNYRDAAQPSPSAPTTLSITGLPAAARKVLVKHFRIDDEHSNAYTVWQAMGSPQSPTPAQFAQLQAAGQLQLLASPSYLTPHNGTVTLTTDLPHESLSLLELTW